MTIEATKTRDLFKAALDTDNSWSPYRQMVANVFNAFPTRALPRDAIEQVARAIDGLPKDGSLADALLFFVRRKVLRRRKAHVRGQVDLYEVNY